MTASELPRPRLGPKRLRKRHSAQSAALGARMAMYGGNGNSKTLIDSATLLPLNDSGNATVAGPDEFQGFHAFMFVLILGTLFGSQLGILWWKQHYYSSFRNVTLLGLWVFPILIAITGLFYRFIFLWLAFSAATTYIILKALRTPLEPIVPRLVYKWFLRIHQLCSNMALFGYILVVCDYFLTVSNLSDHTISNLGIYLVFYGVYFGVLGRDLAELCSERMATVIGFTGRKDEIPTRGINERLCGICNGPLSSIRDTEVNSFHDDIHTLSCEHKFHEGCIRGWIIVGKKETCPYCSEKVTFKTSLLKNPWETQSILWGRILDAVRYLLVWNPLIFIFLNFLISKLDPVGTALAQNSSAV